MLMAREWRADFQTYLLKTYRRPVICFTMNIPGPVKNDPLICRSFRWGLERLEPSLTGVVFRRVREEATGCEAYFVAECTALELKRLCTEIEDSIPLGRLFDMDVTDADGTKLERSLVNGKSRDCIVCGATGRGCASRRLHSVGELQRAAWRIMEAHFHQEDGMQVGQMAVQSLMDEVYTTPKPGLVDRRNSGSHRDMDLSAFAASAQALEPYFRECFRLGHETADLQPGETFALLRQAGIRGEGEMYRATGGVNTHKGAIFTLGILCGCLGRLWTPEAPILPMEKLLENCATMGKVALKDLEGLTSPATAGEKLYLERGITGIRGEVAGGLPSVVRIGLPAYRMALEAGYSPNDAGAVALIHLMAQVEDSNLHHRGGRDGAAWAREEAKKLLPLPDMARIAELDDAFIARNLSPGGCADLLAATLFLVSLYE